jgi:hypothetical protein
LREGKPEASEQIAIYGFKLHLNVHIFSVKRVNNKKNYSLLAECWANELNMFGACDFGSA